MPISWRTSTNCPYRTVRNGIKNPACRSYLFALWSKKLLVELAWVFILWLTKLINSFAIACKILHSFYIVMISFTYNTYNGFEDPFVTNEVLILYLHSLFMHSIIELRVVLTTGKRILESWNKILICEVYAENIYCNNIISYFCSTKSARLLHGLSLLNICFRW